MSNQKDGAQSTFEELGIACVMLAVFLWMAVGPGLSIAFSYIRYAELSIAGLFSDEARQIAAEIKAGGFHALEFAQFKIMMAASGKYAKFICAPLIMLVGVMIVVRSPVDRFRRVHNMKSLLAQEASIWKEVAPVLAVSDELVQNPAKFPPSLTEWEFVRRHNLLEDTDGGPPRINRDRARAVFRKQLGPRWRGFKGLPKHIRIVLGILLIRLDQSRSDEAVEVAREVAEQFAKNGGLEGIDDTFAIEEFKKFKSLKFAPRQDKRTLPSAKEIFAATLNQHAYVYTIVANLFYGAGLAGVFPSSLFVWMKQVDRRFWYVLNNCGRYSFHVEALAPYSHWLGERALCLPGGCAFPLIESGVEELEKALALYKEENLLDRYLDDYARNPANYIDWDFVSTFKSATEAMTQRPDASAGAPPELAAAQPAEAPNARSEDAMAAFVS